MTFAKVGSESLSRAVAFFSRLEVLTFAVGPGAADREDMTNRLPDVRLQVRAVVPSPTRDPKMNAFTRSMAVVKSGDATLEFSGHRPLGSTSSSTVTGGSTAARAVEHPEPLRDSRGQTSLPRRAPSRCFVGPRSAGPRTKDVGGSAPRRSPERDPVSDTQGTAKTRWLVHLGLRGSLRAKAPLKPAPTERLASGSLLR